MPRIDYGDAAPTIKERVPVASILEKVLRTGDKKVLRRLRSYADAINTLEDGFRKFTDAELRAETDAFRQRLEDGESLDRMLPEAFAVVREASHRVLGKRHYDVQLMGGAALHLGNIAEMKTGEGKTLTCVLPAYLNALSGKGVHVVTVNDYLAKRDRESMGRVHRFLGLEVGVITITRGEGGGNAVGAILATLGTDLADARDAAAGYRALLLWIQGGDGVGDGGVDQFFDHVGARVAAQRDPPLGGRGIFQLIEQHGFAHAANAAEQKCAVGGAGAFHETQLEIPQKFSATCEEVG